eukprot:GCRY01000124.1.p2 GENE.GCRY01000124.1~~GCRY01000124.1.p2  ORF type:complete len:408 (+),score=107.61 GCRY01000124.1:114-1337(+)
MTGHDWESTIDVNTILELRLRTHVYFGCGAIKKIDDICATFVKEGITKVICVCSGSAYKVTGAWDEMTAAFKKHNMEYVLYDKIAPNPLDTACDEATKLGLELGAQAVIAVGGGSPIDAGKAVACLLKYPGKKCEDLYTGAFDATTAVPIVAINTTHGTGTEVDRFSVVSLTGPKTKPLIAPDCIYPRFAIDDPALCSRLNRNQTIYTAVDAMNHVTEAATTTCTTPLSILFGREVVRLVLKYLPKAMENPEDMVARYWLLYASCIAGTAFDLGLLHFTHALEHPLSALHPNLSHGLGLAMLMPAVVETIYPYAYDRLAEIYEPLVGPIGKDDCEKLCKTLEGWLFSMGVTQKVDSLGFTEKDAKKLADEVRRTPCLYGLIAIAPVPNGDEAIEKIYARSMKPMFQH